MQCARLWLALGAGLVALVGCASSASDGAAEDPPGLPAPYLAFSSDFKGYPGWRSARFDGGAEGLHTAGTRTVYVKGTRGPSGRFPVGTIIVKEIASADAKTFAMVKRGAGFNAKGARDWEWFELVKNDDGSPLVKWRGVGPPSGESYGGDPNGCNACHGAAEAHDYVLSPALW